MTNQEIPAQARYMPLILEALRDLKGSAKAASVKDWVAAKLATQGIEIPSDTLASGAPKFPNDLQFSRMRLVESKHLETRAASGYGIWKLTGLGWSTVLTPESALKLYSGSKVVGSKEPTAPDPQMVIQEAEDEKSQLFNILKNLDDEGFERLCSLIMTKTGASVESFKGKSGDGGVDGFGRMTFSPTSLVTVSVAWQCKRYTDKKVSVSEIRDFRGAIRGKASFGLFFTTSSFTEEAKAEAKRLQDRIELIDVERLIEVLCDNDMGVTKVMQPVYTVDDSFFEEYKHPTPSANPSQMELKPSQS